MSDLRTIAVVNQRRGVGKTTTTLSLGMKLAERGLRILLVDLDPQASLSVACGINDTEIGNLAEVLGGSLPGKARMWDILRDVLANHYCFLAPSDLAMAQTELGLIFRMGRESVLQSALESISKDFDLALLDCPPSIGLLTLNALYSAQAILIPTRADLAYLRGICLLSTVIEKVRRELNPSLEVLGVVVTYYNHMLTHHRKAILAMNAAGLPMLPAGIEESMRLAEGSPDGRSAAIQISSSSEAIIKLSEHVENWLGGHRSQVLDGVKHLNRLIQPIEDHHLQDEP